MGFNSGFKGLTEEHFVSNISCDCFDDAYVTDSLKCANGPLGNHIASEFA